jgi:hypothetical protein
LGIESTWTRCATLPFSFSQGPAEPFSATTNVGYCRARRSNDERREVFLWTAEAFKGPWFAIASGPHGKMMSLLPRHLRFVLRSLALSVGYVAALHIRFRASASDTSHLRQPLSHCDHRMTRLLPSTPAHRTSPSPPCCCTAIAGVETHSFNRCNFSLHAAIYAGGN